MSFGFFEQTPLAVEVSDYHLIFYLNGVLVATGISQTKSCSIVLKLSLKKFLSAYVKKFTVYKWSLVMKRNFLKHMHIITDKTCVLLPTFRILD
jgi:hypothetical protein